jgi:antitoxin MazE
VKIAKWGNSLAVRLPAVVVEAMGLKEGDDVKIGVAGSAALEIEAIPSRLELLQRLRKYRGLLPKDFHFDRIEANSRE